MVPLPKRAFCTSPSASACLLGTLLLAGCGGAMTMDSNSASSSTTPTDQVAGPPIQGYVYGGHAPIQGAHVYLLQPGTKGYGSPATSILGTGTTDSPGGYTLTADSSDPNVPEGAEYVTTDSSGAFNLTGAYKCTVGQPVYIYAWGGNIGATSSTSGPTNNPNIVQLATLGNCPSSGNFSTGSTALSYIYLNEVSTVATAYTFQPFTLASNNNAWDIGTSGTPTALLGIANAANTAAQLYNIQGGGPQSTANDGEGHLANYQTQSSTGVPNSGNGIVPEATIDTLANILANCVDSIPPSAGVESTQCSSLFAIATDDGGKGGTQPTDTATAAINIARYPAGNNSEADVDATYAQDLFDLPTGTVPYVPDLSNAPHDWTIAINYPSTAVGGYTTAVNPTLVQAESLAVDASGNVWISAQGPPDSPELADVVEWNPLGVQQSSPFQPGYIVGYLSVDGYGDVWTGNANDAPSSPPWDGNGGSGTPITEFKAPADTAAPTELGSGYYKAYTVITAYPGTAYFFAGDSSSTTSGGGALYDIFSYSSSGAFGGKSPLTPAITNGDNVAHGAIDHAGALWITSETSDQIARIYLSKSGVTNYFTPIKTPQQPEVPAIDGSGNAWIPIQTTTSEIYEVSSSGGTNILDTGDGTAAGTAEMTSTFGAAVDGNGNIWFTNRCGNYGACGFKQGATTNENGANTVFVLNGTGGGAASNDPGTKNTFISPPTNYFPEAQYPATATSFTSLLYGSLNLAIDPSGNVWITNYTGGSVVELVGAAAPVRTPLSVAAAANELGQKP